MLIWRRLESLPGPEVPRVHGVLIYLFRVPGAVINWVVCQPSREKTPRLMSVIASAPDEASPDSRFWVLLLLIKCSAELMFLNRSHLRRIRMETQGARKVPSSYLTFRPLGSRSLFARAGVRTLSLPGPTKVCSARFSVPCLLIRQPILVVFSDEYRETSFIKICSAFPGMDVGRLSHPTNVHLNHHFFPYKNATGEDGVQVPSATPVTGRSTTSRRWPICNRDR